MRRLQATAKKLKSEKGETISEVLIALLVAALAIVLLAGMINASYSMITKSKEKNEKYTVAENGIVEQSTDSEVSGKVTIEIDGQPGRLSDANSTYEIDVDYYTNGEAGSNPVRSYKVK